MATLPLDVEGVVGEMPAGPDEGMPEGTTMGHVHLQVRDIPEAEAFWSGVLGFDPTVRGYPGALFVSAGGYHHHVGLNTWGTAGAPPPPGGARGLRRLEVVVPGAAELDRIEAAPAPPAPPPSAARRAWGCATPPGTGFWCDVDRLTAA